VRSWLETCGCERIFEVDSATREGIDELSAYLDEDIPRQSMGEAAAKQAAGLREWEPWPQKQ